MIPALGGSPAGAVSIAVDDGAQFEERAYCSQRCGSHRRQGTADPAAYDRSLMALRVLRRFLGEPATDAVAKMLEGLRAGARGPIPPLEPQAGGALREKEVASGVGQREDTSNDSGDGAP